MSRRHAPSRTRLVAEGVTRREKASRNALRHLRQKRQPPRTLRDYAFPGTATRMSTRPPVPTSCTVLLPIWFTRRDTARRVRQRTGAVMKWAVACGHCPDNRACDALSAALPNNACPCRHQPESPSRKYAVTLAGVWAGLLCASDYALAPDTARWRSSEWRWGGVKSRLERSLVELPGRMRGPYWLDVVAANLRGQI